jgi:hypothetical protein
VKDSLKCGCFCTCSTECLVLDFSHLRVKGVGYARHRSRPKEVSEMRPLPTQMIRVLLPFVPLFSKRVFRHPQVLLVGAFPQLRAQGP